MILHFYTESEAEISETSVKHQRLSVTTRLPRYWSCYRLSPSSVCAMINPLRFITTNDTTLATVKKKLFTHEDRLLIHKTLGVCRYVLQVFACTPPPRGSTSSTAPNRSLPPPDRLHGLPQPGLVYLPLWICVPIDRDSGVRRRERPGLDQQYVLRA